MSRALGETVIQDALGNVITGCTIDLLDPATGLRIGVPVYVDATSATTISLPFVSATGAIAFYLAVGQFVTVQATKGSLTATETIAVIDPTQSGSLTGGNPTGVAGGDLAGSSYPNPVVAPGAITGAKIAANTVDAANLAAGAATGAALGSDVATKVAGVIPIAQLATGTPTGAKFIRDDGTLQTISSTGTGTALTGYQQNATTAGMTAATAIIDPRTVPPLTAQSLIDAATSGGTITLGPYVYREALTISKNITLVATSGTSIRGSDVWDDSMWFTPAYSESPQYYRSSKALPAAVTGTDTTGITGSVRATSTLTQVFVDGLPLRRVEGSINPGVDEYSVDVFGYVHLGRSPLGHIVEVTTRTFCIQNTGAFNLTLTNLDIRHSASSALGSTAGIQGSANTGGVLIVNTCNIMHHRGCGLGGSPAPGSSITGNEIAYNGIIGVDLGQHAWTDSMVAQLTASTFGTQAAPNILHHNGNLGGDWGFTGGGMKLTNSNNWSIKYNHVYSNGGPGLWLDISNTEFTMQFNRCHHNTAMGIIMEISGAKVNGSGAGATLQYRGNPSDIAYNLVWENMVADSAPGNQDAAGGIFSSTSVNVNIHDNLVAFNGWAQINAIWEATGRGIGANAAPIPNGGTPNDVLIYNNLVAGEGNFQNNNINTHGTLLYFGSANGTDATTFTTASNVGGYANQYWQRVYGNTTALDGNAAETQSFVWGASNLNTIAGLNATHGGRGPSGTNTVSAWIDTTNNLPAPAAVQGVLKGTTTPSVYVWNAAFQLYLQANPLPIAPEDGHGRASGTRTFWFNQQMNHQTVVATTTYTIPEWQDYVLVASAGGAVTLTLPTASRWNAVARRRELTIQRTDATNTVTATSQNSGGQAARAQIHGAVQDVTIPSLVTGTWPSGVLVLWNDGNDWWVKERA